MFAVIVSTSRSCETVLACQSTGNPDLLETTGTPQPSGRINETTKPSVAYREDIFLPDSIQDAEPGPLDGLAPELAGWARWLILKNLPEKYVDEKKWNQQKEVFDGVSVQLKRMKLKTHRKKKLVNHGNWLRYEIDLVRPEETLSVEIDTLEQSGPTKVAFSATVETDIEMFGRQSNWRRDVQVYSISLSSHACVRLWMTGTIDVALNPFRFPPDVILRPTIDEAQISLVSFEVDRISQIRGEIAESLGDLMRSRIDEKLANYGDKLESKIARQIEKEGGEFRISLADYLNTKIGNLVSVPTQ